MPDRTVLLSLFFKNHRNKLCLICLSVHFWGYNRRFIAYSTNSSVCFFSVCFIADN